MAVIRGAICAKNTKDDISKQSLTLVKSIIEANKLCTADISAILFSSTADLDACYPATSVRLALSMTQAAFMCFHEMAVRDSLDHCIRVGVIVENMPQSKARHIFLGEAKNLRPDLK